MHVPGMLPEAVLRLPAHSDPASVGSTGSNYLRDPEGKSAGHSLPDCTLLIPCLMPPVLHDLLDLDSPVYSIKTFTSEILQQTVPNFSGQLKM